MRGGHSSMTLCLVGNEIDCKGGVKRGGGVSGAFAVLLF
jgi:hypothetical protein